MKSDVVSRNVQGEEVLLDLASGVYFSLNDTGTRVWQLLRENSEIEEVVESFVREYEVPPAVAKKDILALVKRLARRELLELSDE